LSDFKHDITEFIGDLPKDYIVIEVPKQHISEAVRDGLKEKQLSLRKAADLREGISYTQIARITSGENYNIDTLLKVLDILDLKLEITKK
jgi:HTH-type transcriptional regulator / antitoxin HipB